MKPKLYLTSWVRAHSLDTRIARNLPKPPANCMKQNLYCEKVGQFTIPLEEICSHHPGDHRFGKTPNLNLHETLGA